MAQPVNSDYAGSGPDLPPTENPAERQANDLCAVCPAELDRSMNGELLKKLTGRPETSCIRGISVDDCVSQDGDITMKCLCAASRTVVVGMLSLDVVTIARAEPPMGVTPNVIGRETFDAFNVQSDPRAMAFSAQANLMARSILLRGRMTTRRGGPG